MSEIEASAKSSEYRSIIGIDPSLSSTGWGIIRYESNKIFYIASGVIKTSPSEELSKRIKLIFDELNLIINKFSPTSSAIENTYVNTNFESSLKLSHARAACLLSLEAANLSPVAYAAKQVKKIVSGYGNSDKQQMIKMLKLFLPQLCISQHDEADALAIALAHGCISNSKLLKISNY